jgi:hypothetical protein
MRSLGFQSLPARCPAPQRRHVGLGPGPTGTTIESCYVYLNGQAAANTYGIIADPGASEFMTTGNAISKEPTGSGQQHTGILVSAGAPDHYVIANNRVGDNMTAGVSDGSSAANRSVTGNVV